jgi:phosphoserine phosphatase
MGRDISKADLQAICASGEATKLLHTFLQDLREDVVTAITQTATIYHKGILGTDVIRSPNASDLATSLVLANEVRAAAIAHFASTGDQGIHMTASTEVIAAPVATDLASAYVIANEVKADFTDHLDESGVHLKTDSTNTVTSADADSQAKLNTLLNEIKTDMNAHRLGSMSAGFIAAL